MILDLGWLSSGYESVYLVETVGLAGSDSTDYSVGHVATVGSLVELYCADLDGLAKRLGDLAEDSDALDGERLVAESVVLAD